MRFRPRLRSATGDQIVSPRGRQTTPEADVHAKEELVARFDVDAIQRWDNVEGRIYECHLSMLPGPISRRERFDVDLRLRDVINVSNIERHA